MHYAYINSRALLPKCQAVVQPSFSSNQQDQTTRQALLNAGLDVPSACEQGVCATCLTGVKSGTPLHRDHYLTVEEQQANDPFLPCCSRAASARLVLDL